MSELREYYSIDDLLYLMERLREPETGCPWDQQQDYASIVPSTLEEAYEVADTIERQDFDHLPEELGDLLFQVVFYSQLAREEQRFDFKQVVHTLVDKLLRRHPHVFPGGTLVSRIGDTWDAQPSQVKAQWEEIKRNERRQKGRNSLLDDVPLNLPALSRAQKLQKRAATVGFDWPGLSGALGKIDEELEEVREAQSEQATDRLGEELGDLLFSVVNACRHAQQDSEALLRAANRKFEQRFGFIEAKLTEEGLSVETAGADQLEQLWETAKGKLTNIENSKKLGE